MTEAQRHQILLEMLAQLGFVTVEKVVERLGISPATARQTEKSAQWRRSYYPAAPALDADESASGAESR